MVITDIKVDVISVKLTKPYWMSIEPYTTASEVIVRVFTDDGLMGVGQIHGRPLPEIARIIESDFKDLLVGEDPLCHEYIWKKLFKSTHARRTNQPSSSLGQPHFGLGGRAQTMAAIAGVDIALWDIKGKSVGLPIYQLLGGKSNRVRAYASGGYYDIEYKLPAQIDSLLAEVSSYVELGFQSAKIKVGGLPIADDVERVSAIRTAFPNLGLMLDANSAYDVPTAIHAARAFEPHGIDWLEEPLHWYDPVFGLKQVADSTSIPIASGESELHRWACRDLIDHAGIRIMQFDSTRAGGVTEWLKVAGHAASHGILMAPHHDPQIHGHLIAAVPNGHIQEVFPNPLRDPLWEELYEERPQIKDGYLYLSEKPGFGTDLCMETVTKYRVHA